MALAIHKSKISDLAFILKRSGKKTCFGIKLWPFKFFL